MRRVLEERPSRLAMQLGVVTPGELAEPRRVVPDHLRSSGVGARSFAQRSS